MSNFDDFDLFETCEEYYDDANDESDLERNLEYWEAHEDR